MVVVARHLWRVDHVLANQLHGSISHCWRAIEEVTLDTLPDAGLLHVLVRVRYVLAVSTYHGQYGRITHDDLTKCAESLRTHKDDGGIQGCDNDVEDGLERVLHCLDSANLFGQPVDTRCLFLRSGDS